jgi:hypothetical protein
MMAEARDSGSGSGVIGRLARPEAIGLAVLCAVLAAIGWVVSPFWLAVVIGLQLAAAGLGAVYVIGPARPRLGFARYVTFATAAVSLTMFGRLAPPGVALLLTPVVAVVLWSVLWLELRLAAGLDGSWMLDLALVAILFAGSAGIWQLFADEAWQLPLALVLLLSAVLAVRSAEARGWTGAQAIGQALLHVLAVAQAATALALLGLPGLVVPAIAALVFHAWGGAADALAGRASLRSVALEFGSLGLLALVTALVMAFLVHQPG